MDEHLNGNADPVQLDPALLQNDPVPAAPQPYAGEPQQAPIPQPVYAAQPPVQQPTYPSQPIYGQPTQQRGFAPQQGLKFCQHCGAQIPTDAVICTACGRQVAQLQQPVYGQPIVINNNNNNNNNIAAYPQGRRKSKGVALLLCFFLGWLGIHRFYEGKILTGLLWMFTFGLFGIGEFIDFIILLCKPNPYYV